MRRWAGREPRRRAAQRRGRRLFCPDRGGGAAEHGRLLGPARLRTEPPGAAVVLRRDLAGTAAAVSGCAVQIIGFNAGEEAHRLARVPGVVLTPDLTDFRATVGEHAVVVMPFNSGGGVKNKLLEAASDGQGGGVFARCSRATGCAATRRCAWSTRKTAG